MLGVLTILFGAAAWVCLRGTVKNEMQAAFGHSWFFPSEADIAEKRADERRSSAYGYAFVLAAVATIVCGIASISKLPVAEPTDGSDAAKPSAGDVSETE